VSSLLNIFQRKILCGIIFYWNNDLAIGLLKNEKQESKPQFAETVKQSIQEEISKATSNKEKGDRFLEWVVVRLLDTSPDEIRNQIVDGKDDEGIDAWIIPDFESENGGVIQLFQCKYGESHDDSQILKFEDDVDKFLKSKVEDIPRKDMKQLLQLIKKGNLETDYFILLTKQLISKVNPTKSKYMGLNKLLKNYGMKLLVFLMGLQKQFILKNYYHTKIL